MSNGKFINKQYTNTIDSLTKGTINKVKNANYVFNNKTPVIVDYWNLNTKGTTFDEGTRAEYRSIGKDSPMRYNKITDAVIYTSGIMIEFDVQYDEDGLSSSNIPNIGGIILPNTWIPYAGDYFMYKHAGKDWLYKVTSVSFDTLDNGNNVYKFEAMFDNYGTNLLEEQVVERYKMIINNVGTDFSSVIKEEDYDNIDKLDRVLNIIRDYYIALFYNDRVQTFTYNGYYGGLYDPYMIEFIIRNDILQGSTEYIYVNHEIQVPRTFAIEYNQTCFRALETKTKSIFSNKYAFADTIDNIYSLFATTSDQYYIIDYSRSEHFGSFQPLDAELISMVQEDREIDLSEEKSYYNIIVRYFNNKPLDSTIIPLLENIKYENTSELFYAIPMIIFCIEDEIKKLIRIT